MERIQSIQTQIEEAIAKFQWLEVYTTRPYQGLPMTSMQPKVHPKLPRLPKRLRKDYQTQEELGKLVFGEGYLLMTDEILQAAKKILQRYKREFINSENGSLEARNYLHAELHKIKELLELDEFYYFPQDNSTITCFPLSDVWLELPEGRVFGMEMEICLPSLLATCWYFIWLTDKSKVMGSVDEEVDANERLIWNGAQNGLADIFRQMKILTTPDGRPLLDMSYTSIAQFLKRNFECFSETNIDTIRGYMTKEKERPKKASSKVTLTLGFPDR